MTAGSTTARDRVARAEALFMGALEQPAAARERWLAGAAGGDDALRAEVVALLALDESATPDYLVSRGAPLVTARELAPGDVVAGRYRVEAVLGAGGVGVVYRAEQQAPVRRSVALKILRAGRFSPSAVESFRAETRALSLMSHPAIARVYDAGETEDGQLWVAMELVEGEPLTAYCARAGLGFEGRLRLFLSVCRAVHHAHQKGIIHRDLKPSNILVGEHEGVAHPKLIDFGIATAVAGSPDDATGPAGTPAYMSPEQARADVDVDITADVYALGVILYEIMTGSLPRDVATLPRDLTALHDALARAAPAPPSRRVRRPAEGAIAPIEARRLTGEVDWIVARAMTLDRAERYPAVSALVDEVARVLDHRPIAARPPSTWYALRCYARRRRGLVLGAAGVVVVLAVAGVIVANLLAARAAEREQAERAEAAAATERAIAAETRRLADRLHTRNLLGTAEAALAMGDAGAMRASLDAVPPTDRRWEWRYLDQRADHSVARLMGPNVSIGALAVSSDGGRVACGDAAGVLTVWDTAAERVVARIEAHGRPVVGVALSPDGGLAATTDVETSLRVWDVDRGALAWEVPGAVSVSRGAFDEAGETVAFGVFGAHAVTLRAAATGELVRDLAVTPPTAYRPSWVARTPRPERAPLRSGEGPGEADPAAARPGPAAHGLAGSALDRWPGESLVYTDLSRTEGLDPATGATAWAIPARLAQPTLGGAFWVGRPAPDYREWAVYDPATGAELWRIEGCRVTTDALDVSPDGRRLATGETSTAVTLKDRPHAGAGAPEVALPGHEGSIAAVVFGARGRHVYSADTRGEVRVWDAARVALPFSAPRTNDVIVSAAVGRRGDVVVTGGWGGLKLWDATLGIERWTRLLGRAYVSAVALGPNGERVAAADWAGRVWILAAGDGAELARIQVADGRLLTLAWSPDGRRLAVGGTQGELDILDVASARVVHRRAKAHGAPIQALAFSPDGALLASGSGHRAIWPIVNEELADDGDDATVRLWHGPDLAPVAVLAGHDVAVRSLAFAPDGRRLASGGWDRTLRLWSVPDGAPLGLRIGAGDEVSSVAFSPDGERLASAHGHGPILLWDAANLDLVARLGTVEGSVLRLRFSADGEDLVGVGRELAVFRFETRSDPALELARGEAQRARAVVDAESSRRYGVHEVLRALEGRDDLPPMVRERAQHIARGRGDHYLMLNSAAWGAALTPGQPGDVVRAARSQAEVAVRAAPDDRLIWNTLALTQVRAGEPGAAVASLDHSASMAGEDLLDPFDDLVRALALIALRRTDEARRLLDRVRPSLVDGELRDDHEAWSLFDEAQRGLAGIRNDAP